MHKYEESRKMHIAIDNEEVLQNFVICEFYGIETCFCWNASKLIIFPYRNDCLTHNLQVVSTPSPIKKIHPFDGRIFLICIPHGIYKLSRTNEFVILSKNAVGIGTEFWEVLILKKNGIYLDNKQTKSSKLLLQYPVTLNNTGNICTFPLILKNSEKRFIKCLTNLEEPENNLCIIGYDKKLFVLMKDTIQLIYTSDDIILNIIPVKRENQIAGLLLSMYTNVVLLMHCQDNNLVFEEIYLTRNIENISALCAGFFNLQMENTLWILYCDESELYFVKKELFKDAQVAKVKENAACIFLCMQHYNSNVILGLSGHKELLEFSLEALENSLLLNSNVNLCTNMFERTDILMDNICRKTKDLNTLNKILEDEYNTSRRINLYAYKEKFQITPHIELFKLWNYHYLILNIGDILPKNSYIMFSFNSKRQNIFCLKKTAEPFNVKMPIDESKISYYSKVNMDLITLVNEEAPWCLTRNFVNCPLKDHKRKKRSRQDKTVFINAKIISLQCLIAERDFNMAKLSEMKEIIRREVT